MTATANTFACDFTESADNLATGHNVLLSALGLLSNCAAIAIAMCFSTVWIAVLVWVISAFVLGMLAFALSVYALIGHGDRVEALGAATNKLTAKVSGWFKR